MISRKNPIFGAVRDLYENNTSSVAINDQPDGIDSKLIHGIQGTIRQDEKYAYGETFLQSPGSFTPDLHTNFAISVVYEDPTYDPDFIFQAKILPGAKDWAMNTHIIGQSIIII